SDDSTLRALTSFPPRRSSDLNARAHGRRGLGKDHVRRGVGDDAGVQGLAAAVVDDNRIRLWNVTRDVLRNATEMHVAMMCVGIRSEEHMSELQSRVDIVCRRL